MGQLVYYALVFGGAYILRYPLLTSLAILIFLLRDRLPDPYVWMRTRARMRQLQIAVDQNPDNATARRDLAMIWLERRAPRRAEALLLGARRRDPSSAELAYLLARSRLALGEHESAAELCVEAATRDPKLRYGDVYRVAAVALVRMGKWPEAEDALMRWLEVNASAVEGWTRLARVLEKRGDKEGASKALTNALEAFDQSPRFRQKRELGWYLRARLTRATI